MPRIRTIKPEFWDDEKLAGLDYGARLLFIGTWNFADDIGVVKGAAIWMKNRVFPYDEKLRLGDVQKWLKELEKARMLVPLNYNGESYYVIRTFNIHQKIDRPNKKNLSVPEDAVKQCVSDFENNLRVFDEHSTSNQRAFAAGKEGKGRERKGTGSGREDAQARDTPPPDSKKNKLKDLVNNRSHLFTDSEFFDFKKFEAAFTGTDYEHCDLQYYYNRMANWAGSKGVKRKDWIAQARNFMLGDANDNKLKLKNGNKLINKNGNNGNVDKPWFKAAT